MSDGDIVELDVRPLLKDGIPPLGTIMDAMYKLDKGQSLRLTAPFEPMPLYTMFEQNGYTHESKTEEDGTVVILFTPEV